MNEQDALLGRTLAERYRVDARIARGGMASVYRAHDTRLDRDVAVKVLSPPYADDLEFTARFLGEARAAASLTHPSLVHVYDSGSDDGAHFIVMELLDRHRTLAAILDERGRLPADEVVAIGAQLLAGLGAVHERGLVHCDVKPANVMIGDGPAKLIDFGIATAPRGASEGDTSIGSLRFMSPEQLHGESLAPASDIFSLGAVMYEALTGSPPYPGSSPEEVSDAHANATVAPPSSAASAVSPRLDAVVLQALRRDPAARFHSAPAMAVALEAVADDGADRIDDRDETRVISTGYVPPKAPAPRAEPRHRQPPRAARQRARPGSILPLLGTLGVLVAAALVVLLVIVPLLQLGRGAAPSSSPTVVPTAAPTPGSIVTVPNVVGMPTADAIDAARGVGLDWTVRCAEDQSQPEGIIDQEPPADAQVRRGSPFTMYSARISDCR